MTKSYVQELPENYNGNFVVTNIFEGEMWANTFRIMDGKLFAYLDETWHEQDESLEEMYRDAEIVEIIIYEADEEENEEGWEEEEVADAA